MESNHNEVEIESNRTTCDSQLLIREAIVADDTAEWMQYWSEHGDNLVWQSWVDKYKDYIDPAFLNASECDTKRQGLKTEPDVLQLPTNQAKVDNLNTAYSTIATESNEIAANLTPAVKSSADWDALWQTHFEEEYRKHYEFFCLNEQHINRAKSQFSENFATRDVEESFNSQLSPSNVLDLHKMNLGSSSSETEVAEKCFEEKDIMYSMGLPLHFGKRRKKNKKNKASDLGNRVMRAFDLLGIEFSSESSMDTNVSGYVNYKEENITLKNGDLKLYQKRPSDQPKHIYFDDDGEEIVDDHEVSMEFTLPQEEDFAHATNDLSDDDEVLNKADSKILRIPMKKKKKKKSKRVWYPEEIKGKPWMLKYWYRRYALFSHFDQGIQLDEESWYSVTPENVARATAERMRCGVVIDAFCGVGGNAIQFAKTCKSVIAVDIDPQKIEMARHNARIYGVEHRIQFITADFLQLCASSRLYADAVFLSPPWGGPSYNSVSSYDLEECLQPVKFSQLFRLASAISSNIAFYLPRNSNVFPAVHAIHNHGGVMEIEQNFVNKKEVAVTIYFNNLVNKLSQQKSTQ